MATEMATEKVPKVPKNHVCLLCDYNTSRFSQYVRHLSTLKHENNVLATDGNRLEPLVPLDVQCGKCNKRYKDRTGLWKHNKTCIVTDNTIVKKEENFGYIRAALSN